MKDIISFIKNYSTSDFIYFFAKESISILRNQMKLSQQELKCCKTFPLDFILHGFIHEKVEVMLSAW